MTPDKQYIDRVGHAVGFGKSLRLSDAQLVNPMVMSIGAILAAAKQRDADLDLDTLLELVRHQLDQVTAAFLHQNSIIPLRLPAPKPPKESA